MKIIFNGTIFHKQKYGGISRYFCNLAKEYQKKNINFKISTLFYKNKYLDSLRGNFKSGFYFNKIPDGKIIDYSQAYYNNLHINRFKPDIVHETYYTKYLKKKNFIKITTVYDLIHEKFSKLYKNNLNKKKYLDDTDFYICISENTKKDLIEFYNIDEKKIKVIYLGADHIPANLKQNLISTSIKEPFILYVGARDKYKDFNTLLNAYAASANLIKEFKIICFGGGKFNIEEKNKIKQLKIVDRIIYIEGNDNILSYLYHNCRCFVSTSLYEGFGIPVIEAMQNNCPTFLSNCDTYVEIAKSNAFFFEKKNIESLKYQLENNIFEEEKLQKLVKNANIYAKNFTWNKCSEKTLNFYKSLIV